jgi:hypothetical protein
MAMKLIMKKQTQDTLSFTSIALTLSMMIVSCGGGTDIPYDEGEVLDQYCVDNPDWYQDVEVSADFDETDPSLLVVSFVPTNDIVDMSGFVQVDGADVNDLVFSGHELWLILQTYPEVDAITVAGAVDCTTLSQGFLLTLYISPDGSVTFELSYSSDADGGDVDSGILDTEN